MTDTPYDKQTWRDLPIGDLVAHVSDSAKIAERHYNDGDFDALAATVPQLRDQVEVLGERRDELSAAIAEQAARVAAEQTAGVSPALLDGVPGEPLEHVLDEAASE